MTASIHPPKMGERNLDMLAWKRYSLPDQFIACLSLLGLMALLVACSPFGLQYTLAHDGGYRLTLRATCPPTAVGCDLMKRRDAALPLLADRLTERTSVPDVVVRAAGPTDIVVELPQVTHERDAGRDVSLLACCGAVAILDTGEQPLALNESTAGRTCVAACQAGQYPIAFTGEQIDRQSIYVGSDSSSGPPQPVVLLAFTSAYQPRLAGYTRTHIGKYLTITADGVVIESALIQSEIDTALQIRGFSTVDAAQQLADVLWVGSLPIALTLVGEERVAPSA
jgi:preprotein translocase subunit SecD